MKKREVYWLVLSIVADTLLYFSSFIKNMTKVKAESRELDYWHKFPDGFILIIFYNWISPVQVLNIKTGKLEPLIQNLTPQEEQEVLR